MLKYVVLVRPHIGRSFEVISWGRPADSDRVWPSAVGFGATLAQIGLIRPARDQVSPHVDEVWPKLVNIGPCHRHLENSATCGHVSVEIEFASKSSLRSDASTRYQRDFDTDSALGRFYVARFDVGAIPTFLQGCVTLTVPVLRLQFSAMGRDPHGSSWAHGGRCGTHDAIDAWRARLARFPLRLRRSRRVFGR